MANGTKHFRKRDAILSYLRETDLHPSAEMVYAELKPRIPDLSLGTVYRNLAMFRNQGQIISIGTVGGVERFDGNIHPHIHFVCNGCLSVTDLMSLQMPEEMAKAAQSCSGGRVDMCHLTFHGLCGNCLPLEKGGETA